MIRWRINGDDVYVEIEMRWETGCDASVGPVEQTQKVAIHRIELKQYQRQVA